MERIESLTFTKEDDRDGLTFKTKARSINRPTNRDCSDPETSNEVTSTQCDTTNTGEGFQKSSTFSLKRDSTCTSLNFNEIGSVSPSKQSDSDANGMKKNARMKASKLSRIFNKTPNLFRTSTVSKFRKSFLGRLSHFVPNDEYDRESIEPPDDPTKNYLYINLQETFETSEDQAEIMGISSPISKMSLATTTTRDDDDSSTSTTTHLSWCTADLLLHRSRPIDDLINDYRERYRHKFSFSKKEISSCMFGDRRGTNPILPGNFQHHITRGGEVMFILNDRHFLDMINWKIDKHHKEQLLEKTKKQMELEQFRARKAFVTYSMQKDNRSLEEDKEKQKDELTTTTESGSHLSSEALQSIKENDNERDSKIKENSVNKEKAKTYGRDQMKGKRKKSGKSDDTESDLSSIEESISLLSTEKSVKSSTRPKSTTHSNDASASELSSTNQTVISNKEKTKKNKLRGKQQLDLLDGSCIKDISTKKKEELRRGSFLISKLRPDSESINQFQSTPEFHLLELASLNPSSKEFSIFTDDGSIIAENENIRSLYASARKKLMTAIDVNRISLQEYLVDKPSENASK